MLVDEVPEDLVKSGGPGLTDAVDAGEAIDGGVGVGGGGHGGRVENGTDTGGVVVDPGAHGVVGSTGVGGLETDGRGEEVTPALTHTTGLDGVQAVGVGGTTGQASGQTVGVLVDDDAGLEAAVAAGSRLGPEVHAHAPVGAIGGSEEVGIVGSRAVLGEEDDKVVTGTALALVVDLEVTGGLGEAESVQQVVVVVGSVVELGDGGIDVGGRGGQAGGVLVVEVVRGAGGAVVGKVSSAAAGVGLSNAVVATGGGVVGRAVAVPGQRRGREIPGVGDQDAVALGGIVDTPRVDAVVGQVGDVVDNTLNLGTGGRIDVGQQPVLRDVGLDTPREGQSAVGLDEVDELGLGVGNSTRGSLDGVNLSALLSLGGGRSSLNGELKNILCAVKGSNGVLEVTLRQGAGLGEVTLEEVVAVGEDLSILTNLDRICQSSDTYKQNKGSVSYVDVEVGIVNIKPVNSLLEVDVANAVGTNIVVTNNTELSVGRKLLDELGGGVDVVGTLQERDGRGRLRLSSVGVRAKLGKTEGLDIDAAAADVVAGGRMGKDLRGRAQEADEGQALHGAIHGGRSKDERGAGEEGTRGWGLGSA